MEQKPTPVYVHCATIEQWREAKKHYNTHASDTIYTDGEHYLTIKYPGTTVSKRTASGHPTCTFEEWEVLVGRVKQPIKSAKQRDPPATPTKEELLAEAKNRYPNGSYYRALDIDGSATKSVEHSSYSPLAHFDTNKIEVGIGWVYVNGVWAERCQEDGSDLKDVPIDLLAIANERFPIGSSYKGINAFGSANGSIYRSKYKAVFNSLNSRIEVGLEYVYANGRWAEPCSAEDDTPDPEERTSFEAGDYIVITRPASKDTKYFKYGHIYKQQSTGTALDVVESSHGSTFSGTTFQYKDPSNWRFATTSEIKQYVKAGKPVNVLSVKEKTPAVAPFDVPPFKVGDWVYAENQGFSEFRAARFIPIFKIEEIAAGYLRPVKGEVSGSNSTVCRLALPHEIPNNVTKETPFNPTLYASLINRTVTAETLNNWTRGQMRYHNNAGWSTCGSSFIRGNDRTILRTAFIDGKRAFQVSGTSSDLWLALYGFEEFLNGYELPPKVVPNGPGIHEQIQTFQTVGRAIRGDASFREELAKLPWSYGTQGIQMQNMDSIYLLSDSPKAPKKTQQALHKEPTINKLQLTITRKQLKPKVQL
jgi:hypothetical protein